MYTQVPSPAALRAAVTAVASVASVFWDLDLNGHGLTRTPVEETACWSDGGTQQKV